MTESLARLYRSGHLAAISADVVAIYTYLRLDAEDGMAAKTRRLYDAQGKLASFATVHSIGQALGLSALAMNIGMQTLVSQEWVKSIDFEGDLGYIVGIAGPFVIAYLAENAPQGELNAKQTKAELLKQTKSDTQKIREAEACLVARRAEDAKVKRAGAKVTPRNAAYGLARHFVDRYTSCIGGTVAGIGAKLEHSIMASCLKIVDYAGSLEAGKAYLDFALESWDDVRAMLNTQGKPTLGFLGNANVFQRVHDAMTDGFPKQVDTRTRASNTDWSNEKDGW